MFLSHLYGGMDEPDQKIIDVYICKLRRKVRRPPAEGSTSRWSGAAGQGYIACESGWLTIVICVHVGQPARYRRSISRMLRRMIATPTRTIRTRTGNLRVT